ncbi:MAG: hypothetical protein HYT36_01040, partial [Candidatus Staskawiczbacteria bacterium]|nr:hypothetical protein [Candidatus Staskawiczbacteria bacterium]
MQAHLQFNTQKETEMRSNNLRMVFFPSLEEFRKARQIEEVRAIGYGLSPGSIVVPAKVVPLLKAKVLVSHISKPVDVTNLTPEQIKKIADGKADIRNCYGANFFITLEFLVPWK